MPTFLTEVDMIGKPWGWGVGFIALVVLVGSQLEGPSITGPESQGELRERDRGVREVRLVDYCLQELEKYDQNLEVYMTKGGDVDMQSTWDALLSSMSALSANCRGLDAVLSEEADKEHFREAIEWYEQLTHDGESSEPAETTQQAGYGIPPWPALHL